LAHKPIVVAQEIGHNTSNGIIDYYGNVKVGQTGDLTMDDLRALGFQAFLVAVGAQGTKWLGLPGEELRGVYHAKDNENWRNSSSLRIQRCSKR
jgi:NADPH-dependent glutamate synthase beta subunit-like oxidoreductase